VLAKGVQLRLLRQRVVMAAQKPKGTGGCGPSSAKGTGLGTHRRGITAVSQKHSSQKKEKKRQATARGPLQDATDGCTRTTHGASRDPGD
jgi:hypothetical protein